MKTLIITESVLTLLMESKRSMAAGVLPICEKTGRILIVKRSGNITFPNSWCNLGGGGDDGESPKQNAMREFREESLFRGAITLKKDNVTTNKNVHYHNFFGFVKNEFTPKVNVKTIDGEVEISDFEWVTFVELYKRLKKNKFQPDFKKYLTTQKKVIHNIIYNLI